MVEPTGRCEHLINVRKGRIEKCDNYLDRHPILGDGYFVESALAAGSERLERCSRLKAAGYDFERIAERVAVIFDMPLSEVLREGTYARTVAARSLLCYWANRELGVSTVDLARRLNLAQPTVSQSVDRGEWIAAEKRVTLLSK